MAQAGGPLGNFKVWHLSTSPQRFLHLSAFQRPRQSTSPILIIAVYYIYNHKYAHIYADANVCNDGKLKKRGRYCLSWIWIWEWNLNYCWKSYWKTDEKNLAMDVHYEEFIPPSLPKVVWNFTCSNLFNLTHHKNEDTPPSRTHSGKVYLHIKLMCCCWWGQITSCPSSF